MSFLSNLLNDFSKGLENTKQEANKAMAQGLGPINREIWVSNISKICLIAAAAFALAFAQPLFLLPIACMGLIQFQLDANLAQKLDPFSNLLGSDGPIKGGNRFLLIFRWPVSINF